MLGEDKGAQRSPLALLLCGRTHHGLGVALGTDTRDCPHTARMGLRWASRGNPEPRQGAEPSRELRPKALAREGGQDGDCRLAGRPAYLRETSQGGVLGSAPSHSLPSLPLPRKSKSGGLSH